MKDIFVKDLKENEVVESTFMIMKILNENEEGIVAYIGDESGDVKSSIPDKKHILKVGDVILAKGSLERILNVETFEKIEKFNLEDFLPKVKRPIEEIMKEIEDISKEEFKSEECKTLNNYFFKDEKFLKEFEKGIGGLRQHHNYLGGLAEHTLNTMYLAQKMAYRYGCKHVETAILGAKLHDIGKIKEYSVNGPFSVTMEGEMEGHIVMGVTMLEEAFREGGDVYSEDFKSRMKACIIQHHGKLEYGSPKVPKTEEAYVVHFADYIDATFNKIQNVRENTKDNTWSEYDRRIGTRLFI